MRHKSCFSCAICSHDDAKPTCARCQILTTGHTDHFDANVVGVQGSEEYDVVTLGLGLLINSLEINAENRYAVEMNTRP